MWEHRNCEDHTAKPDHGMAHTHTTQETTAHKLIRWKEIKILKRAKTAKSPLHLAPLLFHHIATLTGIFTIHEINLRTYMNPSHSEHSN